MHQNFYTITDNLSIEIPDIIIKKRGIVQKLPRSFVDLEPFQGVENVFYQQTAVGSRPHLLRKTIGLPLSNPYRFIKADLLTREIITSPRDPVLKKIRSILKTDWMYADILGDIQT